MIPIKTDSAWRGTADCRNCGIRDMVLFADLKEEDFGLIHAPIDDLEFSAGDSLQRMGDPASSLMTLRVGMVKLVRNMPDGRQRIVRVLRSGDVLGLEALFSSTYECEAVALTGVKVCRLPVEVIQRLNQESPRLHQRLMGKWHQSLKEADDWLDLNFGNARQRLADWCSKCGPMPWRGPLPVRLPVRWSPVLARGHGCHARPQTETVSRTLNAFIREGLLNPDRQGRPTVYWMRPAVQPQRLIQG